MPAVMITPEALIAVRGPWIPMLEEAGFTIQHPDDTTFTRGLCSPAETIRVLSNVDAVIAGGEYLTPEVIAALPRLQVIARSGVGYDRVNVSAATKHGIPVTITPTANHESVAETAFALVFAIAKGIVTNDACVRSMGQKSNTADSGKDSGNFRAWPNWSKHRNSWSSDGDDGAGHRNVSGQTVRCSVWN